METENKLRLSDVFSSITDLAKPARRDTRSGRKRLVAVNGVLAGADTFVEIEAGERKERKALSMAFLSTPSGDCLG